MASKRVGSDYASQPVYKACEKKRISARNKKIAFIAFSILIGLGSIYLGVNGALGGHSIINPLSIDVTSSFIGCGAGIMMTVNSIKGAFHYAKKQKMALAVREFCAGLINDNVLQNYDLFTVVPCRYEDCLDRRTAEELCSTNENRCTTFYIDTEVTDETKPVRELKDGKSLLETMRALMKEKLGITDEKKQDEYIRLFDPNVLLEAFDSFESKKNFETIVKRLCFSTPETTKIDNKLIELGYGDLKPRYIFEKKEDKLIFQAITRFHCRNIPSGVAGDSSVQKIDRVLDMEVRIEIDTVKDEKTVVMFYAFRKQTLAHEALPS